MNPTDRAPDNLHLAIETTGRGGSLTLFRGVELLDWVVLESDQRAAAAIGPHLDRMLSRCRQETEKGLGQVTVADGPGSFTGLRVAVTTAKTLAYALKIELAGVDSLAAIAAATFHDHAAVDRVVVALDAYRGQVFWGQFDRSTLFDQSTLVTRSALVPPTRLVEENTVSNWSRYPDCVVVESMKSFAAKLNGQLAGIAIAGDTKPFGDRAGELLPRSCDAIGVAALGRIAASRGDFTDPMALLPRYFKVSAAEEKAGV